MEKIIRTIRRYTGRAHVGLRGDPVVLLAVHRDDAILDSDELIGRLRPGDMIEFAPLITEADGSERTSCVTSDGFPGEFGRIEGWYEGSGGTWIVVSKTSPENVGQSLGVSPD